MTSDDGAKLWLDKKELLDLNRDGGGHAEQWLKLDAGYHRIEVQFFENFAEERLEVGLHGPGISVENIPAQLLYHE